MLCFCVSFSGDYKTDSNPQMYHMSVQVQDQHLVQWESFFQPIRRRTVIVAGLRL